MQLSSTYDWDSNCKKPFKMRNSKYSIVEVLFYEGWLWLVTHLFILLFIRVRVTHKTFTSYGRATPHTSIVLTFCHQEYWHKTRVNENTNPWLPCIFKEINTVNWITPGCASHDFVRGEVLLVTKRRGHTSKPWSMIDCSVPAHQPEIRHANRPIMLFYSKYLSFRHHFDTSMTLYF